MELLNDLAPVFRPFLPLLVALACVSGVLAIAHRWGGRRAASGGRFMHHIVMLALTAAGLIILVLTLPTTEETRGQLLSLLGLVLTAMIAISSTTFVANAMAGLMLRAVRNFRPGDFVRVGDQFGRVTERGLFHTEIQTEERNLATLPNLYLITNPVTVTHDEGTIVSATLSLGYDVPRTRIEELLKEGAEKAELHDPFVHVLDLGDFSVSYRISGVLDEVKNLLSARSSLRKCILDSLHSGGIEIVSPNYVTQRRIDPDTAILPKSERKRSKSESVDSSAEEIVFDKADQAEALENLRREQTQLAEQIKENEAELTKLDDKAREVSAKEIKKMKKRLEAIEQTLSAPDEESTSS